MSSKPVRAPLGTYTARLDDKGRLKLPSKFEQWLDSLGRDVFVTSFDMRSARIYPISTWEKSSKLFLESTEDPVAAKDIWFLAQHNGADTEVDGQGRVMIHPELRRQLGIEKQQVYLECFNDRINIYSQAVYEERLTKAQENLQDKIRSMEMRGLL